VWSVTAIFPWNITWLKRKTAPAEAEAVWDRRLRFDQTLPVRRRRATPKISRRLAVIRT
jgi:hypothetical protein